MPDKKSCFCLKISFYILVSFIFLLSCKKEVKERTSAILAPKFKIFHCDTAGFIAENVFPYEINRFEYEINKFKKLDKESKQPENAIVFTGSSSIRKWDNLQEMFPQYKIIKRGFGGSTFPELIYYANDLIFKYKPKIVVIYEGDNDQYILTAEDIYINVCYLSNLIHQKLPKTKIIYLSAKPSPSRIRFLKSTALTNIYIEHYCQTDSLAYYVDIFDPMFDENGKIRTDIFKGDSLHLNNKGYKIWQKALLPLINRLM